MKVTATIEVEQDGRSDTFERRSGDRLAVTATLADLERGHTPDVNPVMHLLRVKSEAIEVFDHLIEAERSSGQVAEKTK